MTKRPLKEIKFSKGTTVHFDGGPRGYFVKEIKGDNRLTYHRIATMGNGSYWREWTYHGYGGYYPNCNIPNNNFEALKAKLESAGVTVTVKMFA